MSKKINRFMELEGLRGLAAISVVLTHLAFLFYPALRDGNMALAHSRFEDNVYGTPLTLLFAGTLAVAIFFVLSGFVLSIGFFKTGDENIVKKLATGRYLRLMLPALASVLIAFLLIQLGAHTLTSNAGEIANSHYLSIKWNNSPGFFETIKTGAFDIFVQYKGDSRTINHVLWTMNVEFIGSFLVFGFLLLFAKSKYRWIAYGALTIGTFGTWYLGFVIGVMIADAYNLGWLERFRLRRVILPMTVIAVFLGVYPKNDKGTIYEFLDLSTFQIKERVLYLTIAATFILLAVLLSKRLTSWLQKPMISSLGKYTFSLYLTHLLVIYTVTTSVIIVLHDVVSYNLSVLLACLISLPVFWAVSYFFERYIDVPSIKLSKYVGAIYRGEQKVDWAKNARTIKRKIKKIVKPRAKKPEPELDEGVD